MSGEVARLFISIGADVAEAIGGLGQVSDRLTKIGQRATITGGMLTAGLTLPMLGVVKGAMDLGTETQNALNYMQAVTGATGDEMARVSQVAQDLGADMTLPATSAADAALAMVELGKAGFNVQQSMDAAKGTLQLAAAAQVDEARAAEIAANALNAFKLQASDATFVADELAATANASSVEIGDVAESMKMASAVYSSFQGPVVGAKEAMTDLNTAIGILGNAGIKGSDAGTSLKQMLLQLTGPSAQSKAAMQQLAQSVGLSGDIAFDATGKMRSLPEIMDITARATKGMTDEERDWYITQIFGAHASQAVIQLMAEGVDGWDKMHAAVSRASAASELANARMKGLGGALDGLKSQVESLAIQGFNQVAPAAEGFVRDLANLVPLVAQVDPRLLTMAVAFAAVLAVAGPVVAGFGALAVALGFFLSPLGLVIVGFATLAALFAGDVGGLQGWAQALWVLLQPLLQGQWTIGQFITQLGMLLGIDLTPLAAGFEWLWTVIQVGASIVQQALGGDVSGAIARFWSLIQEMTPQLGAQLAQWGEQFVAWVIPAATQMLINLLDLGLRLIYWIAHQVGPIADRLLSWALAFVDWIIPMVPQVLDGLLGMLEQIVDWIIANGPTLLRTVIGEWVPAIIGWVALAAIDIIPRLVSFLGTIIDWIVTKGVPKLVELGFKLGQALVGGIKDGLGDILGKIGEKLGIGGPPAGALNIGAYEGMAHGGIISEPIIGFGLRSGAGYTFGEGVREAVVPLAGSGGASGTYYGGAGGGGDTVVLQLNGPIYGFSDFEDKIVLALERAKARGRA